MKKSSHKSAHKSNRKKKKSPVSRAKAKKILKEGAVRGKKLTKKQRGFFGARASGKPVRRKKR